MLHKLNHTCPAFLIFTALMLGLGFAVPAGAQTTGGTIVGLVTDAQGAVLPGVALTAHSADTGMTRTTVTEADGKYRLAGLPPGRYDVRTELAGFAPVEVKDLTMTIGLEVTRNITLELEGVKESVTVTGASSVVETTKTDVSGVITQQQIESLPLASRQPVALALLMPGTSQDAVRPRKFNANLGAGGFTNAGAYLIDGVWNKEPCTGEPRQDFPQASIQEFKVNLSNATAEFGWTASGVVTIATRSGTNLFSGEGFEYFRDKSLNTENEFEQAATNTTGAPKPNYRRNQFGGAIGGPIVKDKLHFYFAAERTKEDKYITVNTGQPQDYAAISGIFPEPEYSNTYFAKTDWQIHSNQTLVVRFAGQQQDYTCDTCGGLQAFNSDGGINQPRYSFAGGHTWVVSSRMLNELRGQWSFYGYYPHPVNDPTVFPFGTYPAQRMAEFGQTFSFPSMTLYGWTPGVYVLQYAKEIRDDFSLTTSGFGSHTWKFGGGVRSMLSKDDVPPTAAAWTFKTDQVFDGTAATIANLKNPSQYTQSLGSITRNLPNIYTEAYVQDEWKPASNVTLNLGLRVDTQLEVLNENLNINDPNMFPTTGTPKQIPYVNFSSRHSDKNVAPRVGFAWDVKQDGATVVRAAYGIYYNPIWATVMRGEQTNFRQPAISITNPSYPNPFGSQSPLVFAGVNPQNISIMDNNLQNPKAVGYTGGFSQALSSTMAVHVDGVYNRMTGVPLTIDINPPANGTSGARPNPVFAQINVLENLGENTYKALLVRLERRLDKNYQFLISYTLAKGVGNIPFTGNSGKVTDPLNPGLDSGPTANDRRHVLVASGAYLLPGGVQIGAVWTVRSSMPFNPIAGAALNIDATAQFVPGTTRAMGNSDNTAMLAAVNAYRATLGLAPISASQIQGNGYNAVDMRVNKQFPLGGHKKLELIVQVFNVFGRNNLAASGGTGGQTGVPPGWQTNATTSTFGEILQAYNRQQAELAVRVTF